MTRNHTLTSWPWLMLACTLPWISPASALPPIDPQTGRGDTPGTAHALKCAENAHVTFSATPAAIDSGGSASLNWSVQLPSGCGTFKVYLGGAPVAFQGTRPVQPFANATYHLTMPFPGGTATLGTTTVSVRLPAVVNINGSTLEWRAMLVQALGTPKTEIHLAAGVDMDLSNLESLYISEGVSLIGGQACDPANAQVMARGLTSIAASRLSTAGLTAFVMQRPICGGRSAQNLGPRLYTKTRPKPLFNIRCNEVFRGDNVRLVGFRLQGPHFDTEDGDDNLEQGIRVDSCVGIEIANMELAGWSGQAVYIVDAGLNPRIFNPDAVKIHDNYIHNNQHKGGNGYGVETSAGGYALIEHNVFDFNRHAISASGKPGTGYRAHQNLVLKGGGVHGTFFNENTHLFDVHGDKNCPDTPLTQHIWNCGNAGDQFWMTYNAFQYREDNAIKFRGTPRVAAYVDNNVFAHGSVGDAVQINEGGVKLGTGAQANTAGIDSFGKYGVCDFDGDGKDDLFLATGVTWWYMSSAKMHWVYLNAAGEQLHQLALGDFSGDHRCDVFAVHGNDWVISKGGTGSWETLGTYSVPFDQLRFGDFNGDGRKDIFRRSPDGQWYIISPGVYPWTAVQSSSFPLSELVFGDFNNDRITDVVAVQGGHWSVSWGAKSPWQTLNPSLSSSLKSVIIADINHNGSDDILRYTAAHELAGKWEVSWDGRSGWQPLTTMTWPETYKLLRPAYSVLGFAGRFSNPAETNLLVVDITRLGRLYNKANGTLVAHSLYAY